MSLSRSEIIKLAEQEKLALVELAKIFLHGQREGASTDEPEGSRYITMSDTLARQIGHKIEQMIEIVDELLK